MSVKAWRDRQAEAEARGYFTEEDLEAWRNTHTCLVAEQRERYGIRFPMTMDLHGRDIQSEIRHAMEDNDFRGFDSLLTEIEDRALALKRRQAS